MFGYGHLSSNADKEIDLGQNAKLSNNFSIFV